MSNDRLAFCPKCHKSVAFETRNLQDQRQRDGKSYRFRKPTAICPTCGSEIDYGPYRKAADEAFERACANDTGLITPEQIHELPRKYAIGKRPLSRLLGWGELTYTRLMEGNIPTPEHSAELLELLDDPAAFAQLLQRGYDRGIITETALKRSMRAVRGMLGSQADASKRVTAVADRLCILAEGDLTPSALQSLLYYAQGYSTAMLDEPLFEVEPIAGPHGPEYTHIRKGYSYDDIMATYQHAKAQMPLGNADEDDPDDVVESVFWSPLSQGAETAAPVVHQPMDDSPAAQPAGDAQVNRSASDAQVDRTVDGVQVGRSAGDTRVDWTVGDAQVDRRGAPRAPEPEGLPESPTSATTTPASQPETDTLADRRGAPRAPEPEGLPESPASPDNAAPTAPSLADVYADGSFHMSDHIGLTPGRAGRAPTNHLGPDTNHPAEPVPDSPATMNDQPADDALPIQPMGDTQVDRSTDDTQADRPAGDVQVDRPAGDAQADRSVAGDVQVDRPAGDVQVDRPAGDAQVDRPAAGDMQADRPMGDAQVDRRGAPRAPEPEGLPEPPTFANNALPNPDKSSSERTIGTITQKDVDKLYEKAAALKDKKGKKSKKWKKAQKAAEEAEALLHAQELAAAHLAKSSKGGKNDKRTFALAAQSASISAPIDETMLGTANSAESAGAVISESLSAAEIAVIDKVYARFGQLSGQKLSEFTRSELPWRLARRRARANGENPNTATITLASIRQFFASAPSL